MLSSFKHSPRRYSNIIVFISVTLVLLCLVTAFTVFWPKQEQEFLDLALLGANVKYEQYFENNNPNINTSSRMNWYLYVHNSMTSPQDIYVRVKLLNSTMTPPNDQLHQASPVPAIFTIPANLNMNETLILPFFWSVSNATQEGTSTVINQLTINNLPVNTYTSSTSRAFRLVFELWVYNRMSNEYNFRWDTGSNYGSASTYMWFTLTVTSE